MENEGALGFGINLVLGIITYLNCIFLLHKIKSSNRSKNEILSRLKPKPIYEILLVISIFAK
jgi:hypothetical protein